MLRLKRHIVTEIVEVFLAVIVALILIMVSFQFTKLLGQAASGKIAGTAIYQLVALQVVNLFVLLTPFAFFISMLIALSRLANDNELIAMKAIGFSDWKTYQALFLIALPLAGLVALMTLQVLPKVLELNYTLLHKAQKESDLSILQPGQFRTIGGNTTIFVSDVENEGFSKFFVWQQKKGTISVTVGQNGKQYEKDDKQYIDLHNGSRYSRSKDNTANLLIFDTLTTLLPTAKPTKRREKIKAISTSALLSSPTNENRIEIQRRISPAISILLLAICAPLLVQFNPRENRYGKFVSAILIYAIYANSQYIFQALIEDKKLNIIPGVYSAHIIFAGLLLLWTGWRLFHKQMRSHKTPPTQSTEANHA